MRALRAVSVVAACLAVPACSSDAVGNLELTLPLQGVVAFATTNGPIEIVTIGSSQPPTRAGEAQYRFPRALLFSSDGAYAYVVTERAVERFDATSGENLGGVELLESPYSIWDADISPDGRFLYVSRSITAGLEPARILKVDAQSLAVTDSLDVLSQFSNGQTLEAVTIAVHPNGSVMYLGMNLGLETIVVSTAPFAVVDTVVAGGVRDVVFSADGALAYLVSDEIAVVSTATNTPIDTLPRTGIAPFDLVLSPAGDRAYLFMGDTTVSSLVDTMWMDVVELASNAVVSTLPLPTLMFQPVIVPNGQLIYAVSPQSVHVIPTSGLSFPQTLFAGGIDGGAKTAINP